jgi:hypothetical protein
MCLLWSTYRSRYISCRVLIAADISLVGVLTTGVCPSELLKTTVFSLFEVLRVTDASLAKQLSNSRDLFCRSN